MTKVLVDSNIIIYSLLKGQGGKTSSSLDAIEELAQKNSLVLSSQNLAEVSRVMTEKAAKPANLDELKQDIRDLASSSQMLHYTLDTVLEALNISKNSKVHFFDALLAATMKENSISQIYTENVRDFSKIPGIVAINPFIQSGKNGKSK
ncbi:MAG: PIN domain-containing protein [Candidatus Micrarchaeota archaeon]